MLRKPCLAALAATIFGLASTGLPARCDACCRNSYYPAPAGYAYGYTTHAGPTGAAVPPFVWPLLFQLGTNLLQDFTRPQNQNQNQTQSQVLTTTQTPVDNSGIRDFTQTLDRIDGLLGKPSPPPAAQTAAPVRPAPTAIPAFTPAY